MLQRYSDWQLRLDNFLLGCANLPFAYGRFDCSLFVSNAIYVMTGTDLAAPYRGQYRSRKEALLLAKRNTGKQSIRALLEFVLKDLPTIPVLCAQRGDIVLVKRGANDVSLALVSLDGKTLLAASKEGFLRLPLTLGIKAWRI